MTRPLRQETYENEFNALNALTWRRGLLRERLEAVATALGVLPSELGDTLKSLLAISQEVRELEDAQDRQAAYLLGPMAESHPEGTVQERGRVIEATFTEYSDDKPPPDRRHTFPH